MPQTVQVNINLWFLENKLTIQVVETGKNAFKACLYYLKSTGAGLSVSVLIILLE